ncbi:hypothetical protein D3C81_1044470 [compost metagenome]
MRVHLWTSLENIRKYQAGETIKAVLKQDIIYSPERKRYDWEISVPPQAIVDEFVHAQTGFTRGSCTVYLLQRYGELTKEAANETEEMDS